MAHKFLCTTELLIKKNMKDFWQRVTEKYEKLAPEKVGEYLRTLAHEKKLLQSVLESISEAIIVLDDEKKVVFINSAAREMLGITARNTIGRAISKYLSDPALKHFFKDVGEYSDSSFTADMGVSVPRKMLLQVNVYPCQLDTDKKGTIVLMNDITDIKKRQMDSFQSEKLGALSTLAAGIAHEIGNPLNSIGIHMQLMEKDIKNVKDTKAKQRLTQYVKSAKAEVGRLDKMIRTFLTAVRPASLNLAEYNINHILENVLDFLYYEISDKNIAIEKNYSQKLPLIPLDEEQMRQALFNIIKNAVEAMPNGGQLTVSTGSDKGEVYITFADTGIGIPEENLSKIFDPYFTTKPKGSGLGLMIVRKIVNDHSGRIEVESRVGKGTKMRVFLPVSRWETKMIQDKTAKQKG